ncbi:MAG TPA: phospholipid carrier-dependent glycosyltransferase [Capsulimonadaceae bacterium]
MDDEPKTEIEFAVPPGPEDSSPGESSTPADRVVDPEGESDALESSACVAPPPAVPELPHVANAFMAFSTVLFVVLALLYNFLTPFVSPSILLSRDGGMTNPDEHEHFRYVQTVAETHKLPTFGESGNTEGHQPPLYYLIASIVYPAGATVEDAGHRVRLVSTIFGVGLLWVMFLALRELWPDKPASAALTASIGALIPMNVALCSAVNNDSLTNLVFATTLLQLARISRRVHLHNEGPNTWRRELLLLATLLGGGVYIKMSAVMLFGVVGFYWLATWRLGMLPLSIALRSLLVSAGLGLLIAMPWLAHNIVVSGDVLGTGAFVNVLQQHNFTPQQMIAQFGQQWYIKAMGWWTFESYWGTFDSMQLRLPNEIYLLLIALAVVALIGLPRWWSRNVSGTASNAVAIAALALIGLDVAAFGQYNIHFFQAQGRYFLPSLLPLTTGFVGGFQAWAPQRYRRMVAVAVLALLVLLNVISLALIQTYFAGAIKMSG